MGYTTLINSNIDLAFNMIKDLAVTASFTKTTSNSFSFTTGAVTNTTSTINSKVVVLGAKKSSDVSNSTEKLLLVKTKEIGDIKAYDSVSINNVAWKIGPVMEDSGFLMKLKIYREV